MSKPTVFISYSHKDETWKDRLKPQLDALEMAEQEMDVIGFYHSHPNAVAKPSEYDMEHAWPWYSYIIVSVQKDEVRQVTSWQLRDDHNGFIEEKIIIE